jgi:hypothetical protein
MVSRASHYSPSLPEPGFSSIEPEPPTDSGPLTSKTVAFSLAGKPLLALFPSPFSLFFQFPSSYLAFPWAFRWAFP